MAIVVQTVTTCDLCGFESVRPGVQGEPPVDWSELVIRTRLPGSGWTNSERPFDGFICRGCTGRIEAALWAMRKGDADGAAV